MSNKKRYLLLVVVLCVIGGSIVYLDSKKARTGGNDSVSTTVVSNEEVRTEDYEAKSKKYARAQELVSPDGYLNTNGVPITLSSLVGKKVILVDFWTYSCINCQRTIPYLNSWYEKYKDQGFEIIGVHTPEFDFEKKIENVQSAITKFGIRYPVVLDNKYATWDSYKNRYWPQHYLIDIDGFVVDTHIGEGGYAETEKKIQDLLKERKEALGESGVINSEITTITQNIESGSPETYFGWSRNESLSNGKPYVPGIQSLSIPSKTTSNKLYLSGSWNFEREYAENKNTDARIMFKYNAKNVYFVAEANAEVTITVLRDGKPIQAEKGEDVNAQSKVRIKNAQLYKLVSEIEKGEHTIEIIINGTGLKAFTFTFG